jgi:hypothetical protein
LIFVLVIPISTLLEYVFAAIFRFKVSKLSKEDVAAMKLNAIYGRGSKKDFIDLYFLLKEFSLPEMIDFYLEKYFDGSKFMMIKSLTYFLDADLDQTPPIYLDFNWETCKKTIVEAVLKL